MTEPTEHKPRAHLYTRVSTPRQYEDGTSVPANIEIGVNYANFRGLDLGPQQQAQIGGNKLTIPARTYVDSASAYNTVLFDRPEGDRMFKSLKRGDHVIITKLDRGFRDTTDALHTNKVLIGLDVKLHIIDLNVDTSTAIGEMMLTVFAAVAKFESRRRGERVREAYWAKVKLTGQRRKWSAPPGFICLNPGRHNPKYERFPEEHPTMWAVWILDREGYAVDQILLGLYKTGVRVPKAIVKALVSGKPMTGEYSKRRIYDILSVMESMRDVIDFREDGEAIAARIRPVIRKASPGLLNAQRRERNLGEQPDCVQNSERFRTR